MPSMGIPAAMITGIITRIEPPGTPGTLNEVMTLVTFSVVLWNLSALLERELREPFDPDYADQVAVARARLDPSD